jgi:hypothetical protein
MNKQIGFKVLLVLSCVLALIFADSSTHIINKVIEFKVNILGFFLEPFLQWAFDIPLRQAQTVSAWIYMLIATFLVWYLFRKIYLVSSSYFQAARSTWVVKNRWQKVKIILLIILLMIVMGKTVLVFV